MMSVPGLAKDETYYCYSPNQNYVYKETLKEGNKLVFKNPSNKCVNEVYTNHLEITKNVYDKFENIFFEEGRRSNFTWPQREQILRDFIASSKAEIEQHNRNRLQIVKQEQENKRKIEAEIQLQKILVRVPELEKSFAAKCKKHKKASDPYVDCLVEEEKIAKEAAKEAEKKREIARKIEEERIAKMSTDERSAYTCAERFGFRKGSESFKQCVFKLYTAEMDYKKQEQESALRQSEINKLRAEIQALQTQIANQRSERNVVVLRDSERSLAELNAIEERNRLDRGRFALELADQIRRNSTPARQQLDIPRQPTRCRFGPGGWLNCNN